MPAMWHGYELQGILYQTRSDIWMGLHEMRYLPIKQGDQETHFNTLIFLFFPMNFEAKHTPREHSTISIVYLVVLS